MNKVAKLFLEAGVITLTAFISLFMKDRERARAGEVKNFTGISSPYEASSAPELIVDTGTLSLEDSVAKVIELLRERGVIGQGEH